MPWRAERPCATYLGGRRTDPHDLPRRWCKSTTTSACLLHVQRGHTRNPHRTPLARSLTLSAVKRFVLQADREPAATLHDVHELQARITEHVRAAADMQLVFLQQ